MTEVNTMLGPVDVDTLGFVLTHEHVRQSSAGVPYTFPELVDHEGTVSRQVAALNQAAEEGVNTIVDVTTLDLGRDMRMLQEVAAKVNLNIIICTGLWRDIPRQIAVGCSPDELAAAFIREIEVGIENTGVRAGVIKVATDVEHITDEGLTWPNELVLRAASRASIRTGVPIATHTAANAKAGNYQLAIFEEEGVDTGKVCIGHSNDTDDVAYLTGMLKKGCFLGMDRYPGGRAGGLKWDERTAVVKQLVDLGYADHTTLSHDWGGPRPATPEMLDMRKVYNPDDFCFIVRRVLPRLRELGVNEQQIEDMTINGPRRLFGGN